MSDDCAFCVISMQFCYRWICAWSLLSSFGVRRAVLQFVKLAAKWFYRFSLSILEFENDIYF